jgi:asparagine synthase (glutamine-hydrolysing)
MCVERAPRLWRPYAELQHTRHAATQQHAFGRERFDETGCPERKMTRSGRYGPGDARGVDVPRSCTATGHPRGRPKRAAHDEKGRGGDRDADEQHQRAGLHDDDAIGRAQRSKTAPRRHLTPEYTPAIVSAILGVWHRDARPPASFGPHSVAGPLGVQVAFDGRLDNRAGLLQMLGEQHDVSTSSSDAALVACCYAATRDGFITHLVGDFALAVYDPHGRRLLLARDPIGVKPLYYSATPRGVVFGSRIQSVRADPMVRTRPNERLLAELMLGQLHRQDEDGSTFFEGISSVPAAHVAIFEAEHARVEQYWEFDAPLRSGAMSFDDWAGELRAHLATAVDRRLRSAKPVAVSVSGGLDSSTLFCLARHSSFAAAPASGFTYTSRDGSRADESRFVDELERLHGRIEHVAMPAHGALVAGAREHVRITEAPMLDPQSNRNDVFMKAIAASGAHTVMTGHWGDQLMFDQAYLVDALRRGSWTMVRAHLAEYLRWFPDAEGHEFTRQLWRDVMEYAAPAWARPAARRIRGVWREPEWWQRMYTPRFQSMAGPDVFRRHPRHRERATALACAVYREARSKYHALCLEHNSKESAYHGLSLTFPFLDRDLVAFVLGVPGGALVSGGVPKALLREAVRGIVPETIRLRRTKGDFSAVVNDGARRDFADIARLLTKESLVVQFGYVQVDTLIAGLTRTEQELEGSTSCVSAWRMGDLVALELWLQEFFGRT